MGTLFTLKLQFECHLLPQAGQDGSFARCPEHGLGTPLGIPYIKQVLPRLGMPYIKQVLPDSTGYHCCCFFSSGSSLRIGFRRQVRAADLTWGRNDMTSGWSADQRPVCLDKPRLHFSHLRKLLHLSDFVSLSVKWGHNEFLSHMIVRRLSPCT